jgi:hypothetical protein
MHLLNGVGVLDDDMTGETLLEYDHYIGLGGYSDRDLLYLIISAADKQQTQSPVLVREMEHLRRETAHLRSELYTLRRQIDLTWHFPQFRSLPAEIRILIWDLALPTRTIAIVSSHPGRPTSGGLSWYKFEAKYQPPAIANVCREARKVAFRRGALLGLENSLHRGRLPMFQPKGTTCAREWSWFDPSRDTIRLALPDNSLAESVPLLGFPRLVESILLEVGGEQSPWVESLFNPRDFPCLKTISVIAGIVQVCKRRDVSTEALIFNQTTAPLIVDLDDHSTLQRIATKLGVDASQTLNVKAWRDSSRAISEQSDRWVEMLDASPNEAWNEYKKAQGNGWSNFPKEVRILKFICIPD